MAKKKFLGYMCLSIKCILLFCGVLHFLSQPSTKQEYCRLELANYAAQDRLVVLTVRSPLSLLIWTKESCISSICKPKR